ncbi:hypothetical protein [Levilactobacillus acidifarinae]|uniref:Uncharacterized protein n=1 Tax=Levilactobacillus acidifarinae DSM 19394 = JCM 15949 TaxID=1423715 RepID=A0A0R1LE24_9LACO|nr:hypothetical protein [Levilactobacillus acidifarinae]KRK93901.1 hypothetical protein FD25_GL001228 [Levilactobacillus acidifarinae DSM 19394]GEO68789.1 hypothetical protein LAC03_06990 [Levilactobacillus acidifarinae]
MRQMLVKLGSGERHVFRGTFVRPGFKSYGHHYAPTLLLRDIYTVTNQLVTDHLWFNYTLGFLRLGTLSAGDQVQFAARVASYRKGNVAQCTVDYKLARPTQIRCLTAVSRKALPVDNQHALIGYIMLVNQAFYQANGRPFEPYYVTAFHQWQAERVGNKRETLRPD